MKNKGSKIYKIVSVILLVAVMIIIFILSHQNGESSSQTSGFVTAFLSALFGENLSEDIVRSFGHFSEFALLGFLTLNCTYSFCTVKKPVYAIIFSWIYAWTDEIHQIFIPQRAFQISDLLVDLAGIILGTALMWIILKAYELIKAKNTNK